jgi:hypothetical protein
MAQDGAGDSGDHERQADEYAETDDSPLSHRRKCGYHEENRLVPARRKGGPYRAARFRA